jgi:2',3'-cyclic-nucleotide 2'-phosphodiesterase/3'-nucleotidase
VTLRVLVTTDVHGHILPFDYFTHAENRPYGLARVATLVERARAAIGEENCLLVDNGDFLQGTALSDMTAQPGQGWRGPHPVLRTMNLMGYDAATLGNHEFNFGLDWLRDTLRGARFPLTCANAVTRMGDDPTEDETLMPPYLLLERGLRDRDGTRHALRIGLIGLTPPQITTWDHAHLSGRLQTRDMIETARAWIPVLRAKGADLVIALAHSGIEQGPETPMMENAAGALARLPGIDAVLSGHCHRRFPGPDHAGRPGADLARATLHGTPCLNAGFGGSHLGQLDLELARRDGAWRIARHRAALIPAQDAPPHSDVTRALARAHAHTVRLTDRVIGATSAPLHSYLALLRNDPATQLVNDAQRTVLAEALRDTPHADLPVLSASAPFKTGGRGGADHYTDIPVGPLRLRNIADLYGFPNTLCGLIVTGADLRDWLERAAICFNRITAGTAPQPLLDPRVPGHDFDVIDGLSYSIDLSEPARYDLHGQLVAPMARRIRDLEHAGQPVKDDDRFAIATNSYRAWGGGPFAALAARGRVHHSSRPIRDLIVDHVARRGTLVPTARDTWRFAPLPRATVEIETGPGLRAHAPEIAALGAVDAGTNARGFLRLHLSLAQMATHPTLANPRAGAYLGQ